VTLRPVSEVAAGDWLRGADPFLGPTGFEAYARLLHHADDGWRQEGHVEEGLLRLLTAVLERHTGTPDDCYFGLWDGYGELQGGEAAGFLVAFSGPMRWPGRIFRPERKQPPPPAAFPREVLDGPKLTLDHDYLLFTGPLADAGLWGAAPYAPGHPRDVNSPNLMWPADHAWTVTTNIDSEWTGVGGTARLVEDLLATPGLEVVRTRHEHREEER
jgi:hypothetical protein